MNVIAVIQARMGSTRLPGKVLLPLGQDCALGYVITRLKLAKRLNQIVVATSTESEDQAIKYFCEEKKVNCFRGDLKNVLSRYVKVAHQYAADVIVRITADCPLVDYQLLDEMLNRFLSQEKTQYLSNVHPRTYPKGLDIEIFTAEALKKIGQLATSAEELEHVTPCLYTRGEFIIDNYESREDWSHYRWTLDTVEDYFFLKQLTEKLPDKIFLTQDILQLLKTDVTLQKWEHQCCKIK